MNYNVLKDLLPKLIMLEFKDNSHISNIYSTEQYLHSTKQIVLVPNYKANFIYVHCYDNKLNAKIPIGKNTFIDIINYMDKSDELFNSTTDSE